MDPAVWVVLGAVGGGLLVAFATGVCLLVAWRSGRRRAAELDAAREDLAELRARLDELTEELRRTGSGTPAVLPSSELVITSAVRETAVRETAGQEVAVRDTARHRSQRPQVPEGAVLSVTLGEPLVKLASWTYGVRRALSPESRNRIAFAMRREVKRARKERRRTARRARVAASRAEESAA